MCLGIIHLPLAHVHLSKCVCFIFLPLQHYFPMAFLTSLSKSNKISHLVWQYFRYNVFLGLFLPTKLHISLPLLYMSRIGWRQSNVDLSDLMRWVFPWSFAREIHLCLICIRLKTLHDETRKRFEVRLNLRALHLFIIVACSLIASLSSIMKK